MRKAAELTLGFPDLAKQIVDDVHSLGIVGEDELILMVYLTATARLLDRAITLCVTGDYSSGKSKIVREVLELFPPGEVIKATQMTSNSN